MLKKVGVVIGALALAAGIAVHGTPAQAQAGVRVGTLSCNVAGGWGFVFGSSKALRCVFSPDPAAPSITPARSPNSASISATPKAACWFGRCSPRPPIWRRARLPAVMPAPRQRHGRGRGRRQCADRRLQSDDFAAAGQHRRQYRPQRRRRHWRDHLAPRPLSQEADRGGRGEGCGMSIGWASRPRQHPFAPIGPTEPKVQTNEGPASRARPS